jgi:ABC-2 type transport system permease protein
MATETTTPIPKTPKLEGRPSIPAAPTRRSGRWSGYTHLLWARMLELKREPEIIFWVFGFPLLLALGLGIAFRNKPANSTSVAVVQNAGTVRTLAMLQSSPAHSAIHATVLDREAALKDFQFGKVDLVIEPNPDGSVTYHYDPSRPESVLSRSEIDAALQAAAGRKDALATSNKTSSEPGSRYIDFLIPGLLGMNLMNSGMWGIGFALVDMRQRKLLKRFVATPMRRTDFLLALTSSRLVLMVIEVALLLGFGVLVFHMPVLGSIVSVLLLGTLGAVGLRWNRPAHRVPRAENRNCQRPDQCGNDADVDLLRRLLLLPAFPSHGAALHQSPAADRAQRRAQSHHPRRRLTPVAVGAPSDSRALGRDFVRPRIALVPLDVALASRRQVRSRNPSHPSEAKDLCSVIVGKRGLAHL